MLIPQVATLLMIQIYISEQTTFAFIDATTNFKILIEPDGQLLPKAEHDTSQLTVRPRSSVDRASVSEAVRAGSIPAGGKSKSSEFAIDGISFL